MPTPHPATRFKAPATIVSGSALKDLIGPRMIRLVAESFERVRKDFPSRRFERDAVEGLSELGFLQRSAHVAAALRKHLPQEFGAAAEILTDALGPELERTEGNGLAPFFYSPHSHYISRFGEADFEPAMRANYELTKRFTSEFSVRPFLVRYPRESLQRLQVWA